MPCTYLITSGMHATVGIVKIYNKTQDEGCGVMDNVTFNYGTDGRVLEGTSERPSRPRHAWRIDQTDSVGRTTDLVEVKDEDGNIKYEGGHELFLLTQTVVGSWEKAKDLPDYQTMYVPRPPNAPPIQKVTLKYLDESGSMQDFIRRDR